MPTYVYRCGKCGEQIEAFQSFSDAPLAKHKGCGGKLTKVLSAAGIVLKGSGFYKTDSRSGAKAKGSRAKEPAGAKEPAAAPASDGSGSGSGASASGSSTSGSGSSASGSGSSGSGSGSSAAKSA